MTTLRDFKTASKRRAFLEKATGIELGNLGNFGFDEKTVSSRNCENLVGAIHVPIGIAGPLKLKSQNSNLKTTVQKSKLKNYYLPLATTEGALVASVNRGCKAITESGGASAYAHRIGATRGPVFYVGSLEENNRFYQWVKSHHDLIKQTAEKTSAHITYKKAEFSGVSHYVFIRFYFDTEDAMGMNMATIATEKIVELIEKEVGTRCISLAGNFDIDKKPAWLNVIGKRGWKAWAEVTISPTIVMSVLKTTPKAIYDVWLAKCMVGSALSGSLGFNAQFANVIAALFIATGQDAAHVVEGSMGMTTAEIRGNDLYISVYLPDLMVGTIGGGTGLATQHEALQLLGITGGGKTQEFAEIVAGAVLAGEISLLASLAEGSLARAHKRLGRGATH